MEAPNKLFIKPEQIKVEMIPGGELPNVGIQYIRKDKLLAWAKEQDKNAPYKFEDESGNMHWGYTIAIDELIDKLNSL